MTEHVVTETASCQCVTLDIICQSTRHARWLASTCRQTMTHWHTGDMGVPSGCGPPGLRERKKARTHEAIVDAALDLFERKGYEATTVEDIAAAADVSPRTFFRYFDSKQDVVLAKNNLEAEGLGDLIIARPADETPIEAFRAVILERLQLMLSSPDDPAV